MNEPPSEDEPQRSGSQGGRRKLLRTAESQRKREVEAAAAKDLVEEKKEAKTKAKERKVRNLKLIRTSQLFDSFVDPSQKYELVTRSSQ